MPGSAAADIAAAHLYGLFRNLGLRSNALALALAVRRRVALHDYPAEIATWDRSPADADRELSGSLNTRPNADGGWTSGHTQIETELGSVKVEIAAATISLAVALRTADTPDAALHAMKEADTQLAEWRDLRRGDVGALRTVSSNFGVTYRFPESFDEPLRDRQ